MDISSINESEMAPSAKEHKTAQDAPNEKASALLSRYRRKQKSATFGEFNRSSVEMESVAKHAKQADQAKPILASVEGKGNEMKETETEKS